MTWRPWKRAIYTERQVAVVWGVRVHAYIGVCERMAYRRKLYVERVSFYCVCMEDNEID